MKRIIFFLVVVLSGFLFGALFSCEDCPPLEDVERGTFEIYEASDGAPDSGTIEIRDTEVEILYQDENGVDWSVLYKITQEE